MEQNTHSQQKLSTPQAIIVAGVLIMIGILVSRQGSLPARAKTISEQVGVSKDKLTECIKNTDADALSKSIDESVNKAMNIYPQNQRGTPYSIVIGPNGFMTDIRGADSYENTKKIVDSATLGKLATEVRVSGTGTSTQPADATTINLSQLYKGTVPPVTSDEHIFGNPNATVTVIEYSDFECPFCKQFHPTMKRIVQESNGSVRWIYRNYPLHQHSFEKLVAAECVAKIKGNDAYWKYVDLLFGLLKTGDDSVSEQL